MPFKTFFSVLKNVKVPRFLGDVPSNAPPPAFDVQGSGACKVEYGHQRCQFVKTVGAAEASGLAANFVWGRRSYALSIPQLLKFMALLGFSSLKKYT